ncbi:type II secretion system protein, partial [Vibrio sp. 10N.261.45.F1]
ELDLILPNASDEKFKYERSATLSLFSRLPNVVYDGRNKITIRIDRPDKAFGYNSLVKRSGDDSTLLGDWDIGGLFGLTNVKDVALRASNGSQIPISSKLSESTTARHGQWVEKPKCIRGQTPQANLSIASIDIDTRYYALLGGLKPYIASQNATHWQLGLAISVENSSNGRETILTSGEVLLTAYCR